MAELLNAQARDAFISQQIQLVQASAYNVRRVREHLQQLVENAAAVNFLPRERAALRAYLSGLIRNLRAGEIDERTAYSGLNRLLMAVRANSPDMLNIIYA